MRGLSWASAPRCSLTLLPSTLDPPQSPTMAEITWMCFIHPLYLHYWGNDIGKEEKLTHSICNFEVWKAALCAVTGVLSLSIGAQFPVITQPNGHRLRHLLWANPSHWSGIQCSFGVCSPFAESWFNHYPVVDTTTQQLLITFVIETNAIPSLNGPPTCWPGEIWVHW